MHHLTLWPESVTQLPNKALVEVVQHLNSFIPRTSMYLQVTQAYSMVIELGYSNYPIVVALHHLRN